jgi:RNA polymerase sigma factor (sigma-70 family)
MRRVMKGERAIDPATRDRDDAPVLSPERERQLLDALAGGRQALLEALRQVPGLKVPEQDDDPRSVSRFLASVHARHQGDPRLAPLGPQLERHYALRTELALANLRLVSSIARRYRDRGVADADLHQEGFCGLLEAIDRFDPARLTKLSTYATWWIRQAVQDAVAGGAYPVRLRPRHLRQLARDRDQAERGSGGAGAGTGVGATSETIRRIQAATRPAAPFDAALGDDSPWLRQRGAGAGASEGESTGGLDVDETVGKWMETLRPRDRQVLSFRFGLDGRERLSLSQISKVLDVSKERVRQIQERALTVLRSLVAQDRPIGIH